MRECELQVDLLYPYCVTVPNFAVGKLWLAPLLFIFERAMSTHTVLLLLDIEFWFVSLEKQMAIFVLIERRFCRRL